MHDPEEIFSGISAVYCPLHLPSQEPEAVSMASRLEAPAPNPTPKNMMMTLMTLHLMQVNHKFTTRHLVRHRVEWRTQALVLTTASLLLHSLSSVKLLEWQAR